MELRHDVTVPGSPERAFSLFIEGLTEWWPPEYTWAAESLELMAIEPGEGSRCFERGPNGFECDWGRVLAWEPPSRLVFTWQIGPDRAPVPDAGKASEVEVRFEGSDPTQTRVELEHRGFERHGGAGAAYRDALASAEGWPLILDRFRRAAG